VWAIWAGKHERVAAVMAIQERVKLQLTKDEVQRASEATVTDSEDEEVGDLNGTIKHRLNGAPSAPTEAPHFGGAFKVRLHALLKLPP